MSKLRLVYIVSLVILGVLLAVMLWHPFSQAGEQRYSEVGRESVIQRDDQWIIQFDIVNREGKDQNYIINISANGYSDRQVVLVRDGAIFTYIHHVYPETVKETGKFNLSVYKEGESTPFEETTYYVHFD